MKLHLQYSKKLRPTPHRPSRPSRRRAGLQQQRSSLLPPPTSPQFDHNAYHNLVQRSLGNSNSNTMDDPEIRSTLDSLEATRLEIILLALGIFALVVQMGVIIYIGVRRRRNQAKPPNVHGRASQPCLWKEVFDHPPSHEPLLSGDWEGEEENLSFAQRVRRSSEMVAGAVARLELMDIARKLSTRGRPRSPPPGDEEIGIASGARRPSAGAGAPVRRDRAGSLQAGDGAGGWGRSGFGCGELCRRHSLRRHSSFVPEQEGEEARYRDLERGPVSDLISL
ncbi:hypothetical protein B0T22DRAFT_21771 [Podospora appendiculata]|uniref:Uncharacterized protein n=1 Tax=Podospora appendiculata TaxID=314037 RepID=A0AAE0XG71_9PEZI|nr:hypothetical protein B0T22DRAFT_21771 [Podospora appendiculata]